MATLRNIARVLNDVSLKERVLGAIFTKVHAVAIDSNSTNSQKALAFNVFMDPYPQKYVEAAMRAIAGNPALNGLVSVTDDTGSSYSMDTSPITDEQIAAVIDSCWAALLAQQAAVQPPST